MPEQLIMRPAFARSTSLEALPSPLVYNVRSSECTYMRTAWELRGSVPSESTMRSRATMELPCSICALVTGLPDTALTVARRNSTTRFASSCQIATSIVSTK